jgi:probable rRNA maturation factor
MFLHKKHLTIYCEDFDFTSLAQAFTGEFISDIPLAAEIIFVSEEEIQTLNNNTRKVNSVTDVLSFPTLDGIRGKKLCKKNYISDIDEQGNLFIGSIAICTQRAKEQAQEYGHSYERELFYLATHGLCHLLGYDHMEEDDKKEMRTKEETVVQRIGLAREAE